MRKMFFTAAIVLISSSFSLAQDSSQGELVQPVLKPEAQADSKLKVVPDKPATPTTPSTPSTKGHWECQVVCVPECYRKCLKWRVRYVHKNVLVWVEDHATETEGPTVIK